ASGRRVTGRDPIEKLAQYIKENEDNLEPEEINTLAYNLAKTAPTVIAQSSRLKLLRKKLRILNAKYLTLEAIYIPDITQKSNKEQAINQELREDEGYDCPEFFYLENVQKRLKDCNITNSPTMQNLMDIMIMLSMRPADVANLRIDYYKPSSTILNILGTALDMQKMQKMSPDHLYLWKKIQNKLENYSFGSRKQFRRNFHF
ncbi:10178_t:CDS:1, partial [Paraglomus brasilianum]